MARSTSRPAAVGLTVEEIRAERMAQSEARRQRDLRFAEVQREVAERLQQQQDDLVVAASYNQYVNAPCKSRSILCFNTINLWWIVRWNGK
ncbi:MAG: hypothetical protein U0930_15490 [Pirellulales bacterium]